MKRCTRCILPETFPGIHFDQEGVCQYCQRALDPERREAQRASLRAKFEKLAADVRSRPGYHCLVAWSGGKDSTYTLWLLKEQYDLHPLAFTFDNGFVSLQALKNVRTVAENLKVDYAIVKPSFDVLKKVFVASTQPGMYSTKALQRASSICNTCMAIAKGIGLRIALEKEIPIMAYGWSPGQIPSASAFMHFNAPMLQAVVDAAKAPLEAVVNGRVAQYFPEQHQLTSARVLPYNISPLAFLEYDEETILHQIRGLAWEHPQDTDPNSTNCLLNSFANLMHVQQMGYHPYAMELAGLVREGYMDRQQALQKLEAAPVPQVVAAVEAKLGVRIPQRRG
jgi:tRNA(Ile)-lysidine synthase TilS/MesJ